MTTIDDLRKVLSDIKAMDAPAETITIARLLKDAKERIKDIESLFDMAIENAPGALKTIFRVMQGAALGHQIAIASWLRGMDQDQSVTRSAQDYESYSKMCAEEFDLNSFKRAREPGFEADMQRIEVGPEKLSMEDPFAHILMSKEANG